MQHPHRQEITLASGESVSFKKSDHPSDLWIHEGNGELAEGPGRSALRPGYSEHFPEAKDLTINNTGDKDLKLVYVIW